jgi:ribosomal protein L11 methyltransferase
MVPQLAGPFFLNMQNYIKIKISSSQEIIELIIALLSEEGFDGFEETNETLDAFIPENDFDEMKLKEILKPFSLSYTIEIIEPKNWNAEWESNYDPVIVDDFVTVRANFHEPITSVKHEIIITPKMSFGTGHHATTWQMIKLMQQVDFRNKRVFDYGTGTGVLAILAEKLGAADVLAVDYDDLCIENASENIETNHCSTIIIMKTDAPPTDELFDIVLANINRHILLQNMKAMSDMLIADGFLFVSGFYKEENQLLIDEATKNNLQLIQSSDRHNWSSLIFQKSAVQ